MVRPIGHVVSFAEQNYTSKDGTEIVLYVDICEHCKTNNYRRFFEPNRRDIARLLKSIHGKEEVGEHESLEELL